MTLALALVLGTKTLTLSVFGVNGDGEVGRLFANGQRYRLDSWGVASNDWPLGTVLKIENPHEKREVTVPVVDRMAKRFSGKRVDATRKVWAALTSRGYGLVRGVRVTKVKDAPKRKK